MSLKDSIRNLEAAGILEDDIVMHLQTTHHKVRQAMRKPSEYLSTNCRAEIFYSAQYEYTGPELLLKYRTTVAELYKARYCKLPSRQYPSADKVLLSYSETNDIMATATELSTPQSYVRALVKRPRVKKENLEKFVLPLLEQKVTYAEIAKRLACSIATVSNIAKDNGMSRQQQSKNLDWESIMATVRQTSIAFAARKHGISRGSIYYHIEKEGEI